MVSLSLQQSHDQPSPNDNSEISIQEIDLVVVLNFQGLASYLTFRNLLASRSACESVGGGVAPSSRESRSMIPWHLAEWMGKLRPDECRVRGQGFERQHLPW
jgi:hypothetical protein